MRDRAVAPGIDGTVENAMSADADVVAACKDGAPHECSGLEIEGFAGLQLNSPNVVDSGAERPDAGIALVRHVVHRLFRENEKRAFASVGFKREAAGTGDSQLNLVQSLLPHRNGRIFRQDADAGEIARPQRPRHERRGTVRLERRESVFAALPEAPSAERLVARPRCGDTAGNALHGKAPQRRTTFLRDGVDHGAGNVRRGGECARRRERDGGKAAEHGASGSP